MHVLKMFYNFLLFYFNMVILYSYELVVCTMLSNNVIWNSDLKFIFFRVVPPLHEALIYKQRKSNGIFSNVNCKLQFYYQSFEKKQEDKTKLWTYTCQKIRIWSVFVFGDFYVEIHGMLRKAKKYRSGVLSADQVRSRTTYVDKMFIGQITYAWISNFLFSKALTTFKIRITLSKILKVPDKM